MPIFNYYFLMGPSHEDKPFPYAALGYMDLRVEAPPVESDSLLLPA